MIPLQSAGKVLRPVANPQGLDLRKDVWISIDSLQLVYNLFSVGMFGIDLIHIRMHCRNAFCIRDRRGDLFEMNGTED